jgi:cytochrome oxidase Cu insertion factor (SCO1/SenC/PrrC family)
MLALVHFSISRFSRRAALLVSVVALAGCSSAVSTPKPSPTYFDPIPLVAAPTIPSWFSVAMTDVNTGQSFRIADFKGKVVLLDTMATWCPTCQGEMSEIKLLPGLYPTAPDLVRISLDVDPNEDATILKKYAATNKFDWYIAVAPIEVGRFLETNYDQGYLNPPLQPMLFIDRAGSVYGLPFGPKSAISIQKTLAQYLGQ